MGKPCIKCKKPVDRGGIVCSRCLKKYEGSLEEKKDRLRKLQEEKGYLFG